MDIFIQKNKYYEEGGNKPYFKIKKRDGDTFVEIGAAWMKLDKNGQKFYSGSLNDNLDVKITDTKRESPESTD